MKCAHRTLSEIALHENHHRINNDIAKAASHLNGELGLPPVLRFVPFRPRWPTSRAVRAVQANGQPTRKRPDVRDVGRLDRNRG